MGHFDSNGGDLLRVMVAYEDLPAAQRAQKLLERTAIAMKNGGHGTLHCAMWKINDLRIPSRMKLAAEKAMAADVIVISARERAEIPELLQEWIRLWLPKKKGQSCGLLALLDYSGKDSALGGIYWYLKYAAHFGNLAFFANDAGEDFNETLRAGRSFEHTVERDTSPLATPYKPEISFKRASR
jgi:hypothetical protein